MTQSPPTLEVRGLRSALAGDEPTGAVDEETTLRVEAALRERMSGGLALVLVTHDPRQAARLGTRRMHMQRGSSRCRGS